MQLVGGHANRVGFAAKGVFHFYIVFFGAQDDANGTLVALAALKVIEQVQIKVHLARIFRLESADLELKSDQGLEVAVVEEQINEIFLFAQRQSVLAPHETKAITEFEQERL